MWRFGRTQVKSLQRWVGWGSEHQLCAEEPAARWVGDSSHSIAASVDTPEELLMNRKPVLSPRWLLPLRCRPNQTLIMFIIIRSRIEDDDSAAGKELDFLQRTTVRLDSTIKAHRLYPKDYRHRKKTTFFGPRWSLANEH